MWSHSNTVVLFRTSCMKYSLLQLGKGGALLFNVSGKLYKFLMNIKCSQVRKCLYIALSLSEIACELMCSDEKSSICFAEIR